MKLSPARTAAYEILFKIETEHAYSSTLLAKYEAKLNSQDRGLCHEIVLGVLRRQLVLDRHIEILNHKPKLDPEVRTVLRMGLFQLYYLDRVPEHAVVNESVGLTLNARKSSARGLVNAILRSAIRQRPNPKFDSDLERVAIETSHPQWLIEHWEGRLGIGQAEELARSNDQAPAIAFRRTLKGRESALPDYVTESQTVPGCYIADSFDRRLRALADVGEIYFQDEGSQMIAGMVAEMPGKRALDVCASPGGKTTAIAYDRSVSSGLPRELQLVGGDVSWRRVRLLKETCIKQGAEEVQVVQFDAAKPLPFADNIFDRVLVDAPCTGTGTIRHNPEIRYFVQPDDLKRLQQTQIAILNNASKMVKLGGWLIYSTCSLEKEENEDVCAAFLSSDPNWRKVQPSVPNRFLTPQDYARTYPHKDGMDGFFIATFQRV